MNNFFILRVSSIVTRAPISSISPRFVALVCPQVIIIHWNMFQKFREVTILKKRLAGFTQSAHLSHCAPSYKFWIRINSGLVLDKEYLHFHKLTIVESSSYTKSRMSEGWLHYIRDESKFGSRRKFFSLVSNIFLCVFFCSYIERINICES